MELEEAKNICKAIKKNVGYESEFDLNILKLNRNNEEAISTVLQALDNSIPKEKVKARIQELKNRESQWYIQNEEIPSSMFDKICINIATEISTLQELLEE